MSKPNSLTVDAVVFEAVRPPVGRAIAAATLAAVLGASLWALIVIVTDHSFGIAAAGLGILSGKLVYRATGGRRGVLPFAAALDAKQLQRFKNEAQAAAHLHHQNLSLIHI